MDRYTQMEEPMENAGRFGAGHVVLAAFGGALVGAAITILVAPKSGPDTRRQLGGYLDTAKDKVTRVPDALRNAGQAVRETMQEEVVLSKKELAAANRNNRAEAGA
jgi:gas vesicle protein